MWGWCSNCCSGKKEREAAKMQQLSKIDLKNGSSDNFQGGDARPSKQFPWTPSHSSIVSCTQARPNRSSRLSTIPSSNASICFPPDDSDSTTPTTPTIGEQGKTFSELKWTIYPANSHTKHPKPHVPKRTHSIPEEDSVKTSKRQGFTIIETYRVGKQERKQFGSRKASQNQNGNDVLKLDLPDICREPNQEKINQQLREAFEKESRALERIKKMRIERISMRSRPSKRPKHMSSSIMPANTQGTYSASTRAIGRKCDARLHSLQLHISRPNMLKERDVEEPDRYSPETRRQMPNGPPINREPSYKSKLYQGCSENTHVPPSRQISRISCFRPPTPRAADQRHVDEKVSQGSRSTLRPRRNKIEHRTRPREEIITVNGHALIATKVGEVSDDYLAVSETIIENNIIEKDILARPVEPSRLSLWFQKLKKKPSEKPPHVDLLKLYSRTSQSLIQLPREPKTVRKEAWTYGGKPKQTAV